MKVAIDLDAFSAAGLDFTQEAHRGVFLLPVPPPVGDEPPAPRPQVFVALDADGLVFLPHRSSLQREVLRLLGLEGQ